MKKIIRESILKESMKDLYADIQNEIIEIGQEYGGELVVDDVVSQFAEYRNDPLGDPRAEYVGSMSYEQIRQIMMEMVEDGVLTGGYEDFFEVHPVYM